MTAIVEAFISAGVVFLGAGAMIDGGPGVRLKLPSKGK